MLAILVILFFYQKKCFDATLLSIPSQNVVGMLEQRRPALHQFLMLLTNSLKAP